MSGFRFPGRWNRFSRQVRAARRLSGWGMVLFLGGLGFAGCGTSGSEVEGCLADKSCGPVLEVPRVSGDLPLDPDSSFWNSPGASKKITVELGPQMITVPRWPNPSIKKVVVSAARSSSEIGIRLEWKDDTPDDNLELRKIYADQAAVMFPLEPGREPPPITMGTESRTVNIWQWKAVWDKNTRPGPSPAPFAAHSGQASVEASAESAGRGSPVEDLNAEGFSTLTFQEQQDVQGQGVWKDNVWRVVFKRALKDADPGDVQFNHSVQMAVAVWNGANRELNGQKGITGWILLKFL